MPDRSLSSTRAGPGSQIALQIVVCTPGCGALDVMLLRTEPDVRRPRRDWSLPGALYVPGGRIDRAAVQIATHALGRVPAWISQFGAFSQTSPLPVKRALTVAYVAVVPPGVGHRDRTTAQWFATGDLPPLPHGQKALILAAVATLSGRLHRAPIAFRLLAAEFTLSELQAVYEILLSRRLHKASFRRSLQAAGIVEPTDEWRVNEPGRPAQLFRYVQRTRRSRQQSIRFEIEG